MSNELDKLFKGKLADHALPPSARAWAGIHAGLSKKNRRPMILRIAATVLLLSALASTLLWLTSRNTVIQSPQLSSQDTIKKEPATAKHPTHENSARQSEPADQKKVATAHLKVIQRVSHPVTEVRQVEMTETHKQPGDYSLVDQIEPKKEIQPVEKPEPVEMPVVIEYRLATVESPAPAAVTEKEKSGFRKVIDFAIEAKNSSPLGDLREAKDGLFAFNFKKDKQKNVK